MNHPIQHSAFIYVLRGVGRRFMPFLPLMVEGSKVSWPLGEWITPEKNRYVPRFCMEWKKKKLLSNFCMGRLKDQQENSFFPFSLPLFILLSWNQSRHHMWLHIVASPVLMRHYYRVSYNFLKAFNSFRNYIFCPPICIFSEKLYKLKVRGTFFFLKFVSQNFEIFFVSYFNSN